MPAAAPAEPAAAAVGAVAGAAEVEDLVALGESIRVEFKPVGPRTSRYLFAQVVKAVLAMTNSEGGTVVIGVNERNGQPVLVGMTADEAATWTNDAVQQEITSYAEPTVRFRIRRAELDVSSPEGGAAQLRYFLLLDVEPFPDVPVICARTLTSDTGDVWLREGAIYIRPDGQPSSREVRTHAEMRALVVRAMRATLRGHVAEVAETVSQIGDVLAVQIVARMAAVAPAQEAAGGERAPGRDADAFDDQLGDLK